MKRAIIAGGIFAAIVIGALAVAVAGAQTSSPTATPDSSSTTTPATTGDTLRDQFLQELAGRLGVSVDTLQTAINDSQKALIDKAVTDGKLTEEQANDLKARIDNGGHVELGRLLGDHPRGIRGIVSNIVDEAAKVLGIDKSDVTDGLKAGTSLNDIANAHNMSTADFQAALLAQVKTDLDARVTAGDITQAQADEAYQKFSDNIDKITNGTRGDFGPGFGHGPGHGGPGRFWFGGPDENDDDSGSSSDTPAPAGGTSTIF
jgi:polyhydroxyalkanoate synthesis regulator phasin